MNTDTLNKLSDQELTQVIAAAQGLLQTRDEKRKSDARAQILQISAAAGVPVAFPDERKGKVAKPMLRSGDCYINPADAAKTYTVGKGKPPGWFTQLRDKGRLPAPVAANLPKAKEA